MPLTDNKIKSFKSMNKDYKKADEKGLYILVTRSGAKLWRLKYRFDGKEK